MDNQSRIAQVRVGNPFPDDTTPAVKYHLGDHLSSSNVVVADKGNSINREEYTPYGETSFGSYAKKRYRFTGKERDKESRLYYHGARYYAPWLARWLSVDPVRTATRLNSYHYARNNPELFIDNTGLYEEAGHYYTVYLLSLAAGFPKDIAFQNAFFAQLPDEVKELDAFSTRGDPRAQRDIIWEGLHALTGRDSTEERNYRETVLRDRNLKPGTLEFGLALHAFGDSFAHSMMDDPQHMYPPDKGHRDDKTKPDNPNLRPDLYEAYVGRLYSILSDIAKKEGRTPRDTVKKTLDKDLGEIVRNARTWQALNARMRALLQRLLGNNAERYYPEETYLDQPGFDEFKKKYERELHGATLEGAKAEAERRHQDIHPVNPGKKTPEQTPIKPPKIPVKPPM